MPTHLLLAAVLLAQDTRAGKLLAELLAPSDTLPPLAGMRAEPCRLSAARSIETPDLPLPPQRATPPRAPLAAPARPVRPQALPEGTPLAYLQRDPVSPQRLELPVGPRVRVPSGDVNEPLALPRLTVRPVDATPAEDPTAPASTVAALSAVPPPRSNPAPYLRLTLPDPFEHRDVLRLPRPNTDDQPPAPTPVRLPEYNR